MNKIKIIISVMILAVTLGIYNSTTVNGASLDAIQTINRINNSVSEKPITYQSKPQSTAKTYQYVSPLNIVAQPAFYVGKNVKFKAKFDKFSTLGLDYKPAYRSSEKYITVLILRPDVTHREIPLSELKIFMAREAAEKHIDLNAGDEIEISGTVFSKALGDAWMNVDVFNVIKTSLKTDNK